MKRTKISVARRFAPQIFT